MDHAILSARRARLRRRDFLRIGTAGIAGLSLANLLSARAIAGTNAPATRAKNVIMVFLNGGPATIDMWDMKPESPEKIRGEFKPIATVVPGVQVCEHLPKLANCLRHVALVRSLGHTIAEHTQGVSYLMTGNRPSPAIEYPSLGSLSARLLAGSPGTPTYMTIGQQPSSGAGDLGLAYGPLEVSVRNAVAGDAAATDAAASSVIGLPAGFSTADLERRRAVLARLDTRLAERGAQQLVHELGKFSEQAFDILRSDKINMALNTEREAEAIRKTYGASPFGRNMLAARRLIEAGARFVTVSLGDWDTHANNFDRLRGALLPQLDQGLSALVNDLAERGLLAETIVYCAGEFGRTPEVNQTAGRDHWARTMTALVAGGGFKSAYVHGATDSANYEPTSQPCSPDDLSATIFQQLGFPPSHTLPTRSGRPVMLFRNGRVIEGLVS
jgi:uncharacterized protein (DUF1501 family)